jgi:hypothetical protein
MTYHCKPNDPPHFFHYAHSLVKVSHQVYVRLPFLLDEEILQEGMKRPARAWEAYLL